MPLLYGEGGSKAYTRLQEAILMQDADQSLLAWHPMSEESDTSGTDYQSIFAKHPRNFANAHNIVARASYGEPPVMTNQGVRIALPVLHLPNIPQGIFQDAHCARFIAVLCCSFADDDDRLPAIVLCRYGVEQSHVYLRDSGSKIFPVWRNEIWEDDIRQLYLHRWPETRVKRSLEFRRRSNVPERPEINPASKPRIFIPRNGWKGLKALYETWASTS
jgi:hypothetical protein